jgi:hypothetical protein
VGSSPTRPTDDHGLELGFRGRYAHHDPFWLQFWLQLTLTDQPLQSAPQGFGHAVGGVLAERGRDMGVALGLAELGMAEDLLDDGKARTSLAFPRPAFTPLRRLKRQSPPVRFGHSRPWPVHPSRHGRFTSGQR